MNDRLLIEADLFCVFHDHVDNKSMVKKVPYHIMGNNTPQTARSSCLG